MNTCMHTLHLYINTQKNIYINTQTNTYTYIMNTYAASAVSPINPTLHRRHIHIYLHTDINGNINKHTDMQTYVHQNTLTYVHI
jgi:hypothetical protein